MKRLPPIQIRKIPESQARWLSRWLDLWNLDRALLADEPPGDAAAESAPPRRQPEVRPFDTQSLQLGDIRLLAPHLTPNAEEPVYVGVFSEWTPVGFLAAAFSRFSVPALTGELLLDRKPPALRVLNVWNSYSLEPASLHESWLIDRLSPEECAQARAVFRHAIFGHDLTPELEARIGPPVAHPDDPRVLYQWEEQRRLSDLVAIQNLSEADGVDDMDELLRQAEALIHEVSASLQPEEELLAAATADAVACRALVLTMEPDPFWTRRALVADADEPMVLERGQTALPDTQWILRDPTPEEAQRLAHAYVLFLDAQTRELVAEGHVSESGTVIAIHQLHVENLRTENVRADAMILILIPD